MSDTFRVALVVAFYFLISISLVLLNKMVLSGSVSLPAPLFIVWYQLIISLICLWVLGYLGIYFEKLRLVPPFEFDREKAKQTILLSVIFIGMIVFNNLCLLYVEVSFYQVARALTILFNIVFTYYILDTKTSWPATRSCLVVVLGFVIGSGGEANFTWAGVIYGVTSSVFVALYSIYVKKGLPIVEGNHWKLMMYNTVMSILLLVPVMVVAGEYDIVVNHPLIEDFNFWFTMTLTGLAGFLLNIAIFLQIKYTTPLTHNLSGTAKATIQTLISVAIYQNEITFLNGLGIFLVIFGSFLYSHVRYQEMQAEKEREKREKQTAA
jgi:GDP-fucose transporter C1